MTADAAGERLQHLLDCGFSPEQANKVSKAIDLSTTTNIDRKLFDKFSQPGPIEIFAGPHRVARLVATYAEAAPEEICALFGSTDHLEIAVNAASAAERLNLTRGASVTIRKA